MKLFGGFIWIRRNKVDECLIISFGKKEFHIFDIIGFIKISIKHIITKQVLLSNNDIFRFGKYAMYLPMYPVDLIQRTIVDFNDFWEKELLTIIDKYIKQDFVIADIGSNIGNHTVYWGSKNEVKHVYSFEPVKSTFDILKKNIELNNLQNKVTAHNIGISDEKTLGEMYDYNMENIGGVAIFKSQRGNFELNTIDNLFSEIKLDFIKIDVEGHEIFVLKGAEKVIKRDKPVIWIESFSDHFNQVDNILKSYGYKLEKDLLDSNYVYIPVK